MSSCDLRHHPKACVVTRQKYRRPACAVCEDGVLNAKAVAPAIPVPASIEPQPPKKEEAVVEKSDPKGRILARIQREKKCSRSRLTCFSAVSAVELDAAAKELEAEGQIKTWPNGRSCFYTVPGHPDPWENTAATDNNRQKLAATRRPAAPRVAKPAGSIPPKNGGGRTRAPGNALEAALEELVAKREKIDAAIDGIRALIG